MSYNIQGYYNLIENFISFGFGDQGSKGERGNEGEIGKIGPKGQLGKSGPMGDKGLIGPRGDIGPRGPKGIKGEVGAKGKNGLRGDRGEQGIRGVKGSIGPKGDKGLQGFIGPFGVRGDIGDVGDVGKQGEDGYKGLVNVNYGKCEYTRWSDYFKDSEIKCPNNKVGVSIDTECKCDNGCDKENDRDCRHRILCCPIELNDIPESELVLDNRAFSGTVSPDEKEKLINKIWITLKPDGLNKSIEDYPTNMFGSDGSGNFIFEKDSRPWVSTTHSCFETSHVPANA